MLLLEGEGRRCCNRCERDIVNVKISELGYVHPSCKTYLPYLHSPSKSILKRLINLPTSKAAGYLTVTVLEAQGLKPVDLNNKSNPYVKLTLSGYDLEPPRLKTLRQYEKEKRFEYVTEYVSNTLCPVFRGEKVTFPVLKSKGTGVRVEVWSRDDIQDKVVGRGWVGLEGVGREKERWFVLDGREGEREDWSGDVM